VDSDFHTLEDLGTGRGKGLGCLSYGGEGEAEGLYVGHLSAGEKGGGLLGWGGDRGKLLVMHSSRFPPCVGNPTCRWMWWGWS